MPQLIPCPTCGNSSTLPVWDGTIGRAGAREYPCYGFFEFDTEAPGTGVPTVSLNGTDIAPYLWPDMDNGRWTLEISCRKPNGQLVDIWLGHKSKGYTPKGTYILDGSSGGCAASTIPCITIE